jgi:acyl-CoA thioesterase
VVRGSEFDTDTAVVRLAEGAYSATVTDRWNIGTVPNGGYTMAIAMRALLDTVGRSDPLSVTGHFLRPAEPGPAELEVEVVRAGRSASTAVVSMSQGGSERLRVLGSATELDDDAPRSEAGPVHHGAGPPDLPPPEDCLRGDGVLPGGNLAAVAQRFELRISPDHAGWARGAPTGRLEIAGWVRLADGRQPDALLLPAVVDGFPPTVFELGVAGWVPTLELTLHVRRRPAPGWLRCVIRSNHVSSGMVDEDAEVWDSTDHLVAVSRQLARLPRPGT